MMPRQARKLSRTGVYHVMLRGINRQDIFEDNEDYRQMTGCLRSLTERYDEMITRVPMIRPLIAAVYVFASIILCIFSAKIQLFLVIQ